MSDAPPALNDAQTTGPKEPAASRSAGLLGLLARLLDYGRDLLADLQRHNTPDAPLGITYRFGAVSLALIIARITRGIMLATALQDRITRNARRLDAPTPVTPGTRAASPDRDGRPEPRPIDEEAELHTLPSAQEIADRIRRRPIGAVIEEICRDLGIDGNHDLWRAVSRAIMFNGGRFHRLVAVIMGRGPRLCALGVPPPPLPSLPLDARHAIAMAWGQAPPVMATPPP